MTIKERAKNPFQIKYLKVFLAQRKSDDTYFPFIEISKFVTEAGIGNFKKSIDTSDFDIGFFEEGNIRITLDNIKNNFSDGSGFFSIGQRDRSKIKLEAGYFIPDTMDGVPEQPSADFEIDFEGIIDDRNTIEDAEQDNVIITVLSFSSIFRRLKIPPGLIPNGTSFKNTIFTLINRSDITDLFTVDIANINPGLNLTVDAGVFFDNTKLDESIAKLLLASSSVLDIRDNVIFFNARTESTEVQFQFFGKGSAQPSNILSLASIKSGMARVITRVIINNTELHESSDFIIAKYGARDKNIDLGFMTDTDKIKTIATNILTEFQIPKQELIVTTDYIANDLILLDLTTIDNQGFIINQDPAIYGVAIYGQAVYTTILGGTRISPDIGFKVLSKEHNYQDFTTAVKLRRIGNKVGDEFLSIDHALYGSAIYGVSKYNA